MNFVKKNQGGDWKKADTICTLGLKSYFLITFLFVIPGIH